MRLLHRYAEWTRRQAGTTQCHPAFVVAGVLLAMAITAYIYREVIYQTLLAAVAAIAIVAAVAACTAIIVSTVRWYRRQPRTAPAVATALAEPVLEDEVTDEDVRALSREADWLADEGVELAWSPDGKSLRAKTSKG